MTHSVVHFEIGGPDAGLLTSFYRDLFGWEITPAGPGYSLVPPQGLGIGGGILQTEGDIPAYVTFYVSTDDLQASLDQAVELGGEVVMKEMTIPGAGTFAMFRDPAGNVIGIFKE